MPIFHDDPEGQVYLEAIARCISQTATFSSYRSMILYGEGDHDAKSVKRAITDIFAPLAENDIEVDEEIMAHVPRDRFQFMTIHQAKGLEFPQVFIIGLNEGILPHSRSFDDPEAMMEERRLLYVGITRAMDHLYLVFNQNRSAYGFTEPADPSRFLSDIPYHLLEEINPISSKRQFRGQLVSKPERWESSRNKSEISETIQQKFHPGTRVLHPSWGEGMVLNSRIQDQDEIVDIFFKNLGLKKVVASLANLEIKP